MANDKTPPKCPPWRERVNPDFYGTGDLMQWVRLEIPISGRGPKGWHSADQCGPAPGGGMLFNIHPTVYRKIMGDAGVFARSGQVT